jgi:hypothetical protein
VNKAFRSRKPLLSFDPSSKAAQDYIAVFDKITEAMLQADAQHPEAAPAA